MTMTRREFLSASAALAVAPALGADAWGAPLPREADIVVIGAGAAGIAAARRIKAANRKVIVIEATGQIGGRCLTDTATFDVPFDRGARWMHNPDTNPMVKLARGAGLDVYSGAAGPENPRRPPQRARRRDRVFSRRAGAGQPRHRRCLARQGRRILRGRAAEGPRRLGGDGGIHARRQCHRQGSEGHFRDRQGPRAGSQQRADRPAARASAP